MRLFLILLAVPVIEIGLFIEIGGWLGTWPTIGLVVLTALFGSILLRKQGLAALRDVQGRLAQGEDPGRLLADGAMILVAGALLLTPGFFTDAVGFALLMPPVRKSVFAYLRKRVHVQHFDMGAGPGQSAPREPDIIDADFHEVDPPKNPTHGASGWTRH